MRLCLAVVTSGTRSPHDLIQASGTVSLYVEHRDLHGGLVFFDDSVRFLLPDFFNIRCQQAIMSGGRDYDSVWVWPHLYQHQSDPLPVFWPIDVYSCSPYFHASRIHAIIVGSTLYLGSTLESGQLLLLGQKCVLSHN